MASNEATHWWFAGRRTILDALIQRTLAGAAPGRILDVGCGSGGNLGLLARFGRVDGIEHDPEARAVARMRSGLEIQPGSLPDDLPVADGAYDLVALLDVLEHVEEDEASLRAIGRKLASGGRLLITVPAMPWLWSAHDETHHHKRRYTRASLERTVRSAGLEIERIGYFNTLLFPFAVATRLARAVFGVETSDDVIPPRVLNAAFRTVFASERHLVGRVRLLVGLSLFAVVRQPT